MAARSRTTYAPLDLESARASLAADKPFRVGIVPTGYFPEGGSGRVRAVGDPAVDGEEFIQVEVNIAGAKDIIPFALTDLTPIKRGQASPEPMTAPRVTRPPRSGQASGRTQTPRPVRSAPPMNASADVRSAPALTVVPDSAMATSGRAIPEAPVQTASAAETPTPTATAAAATAAAGAAGATARPKSAADKGAEENPAADKAPQEKAPAKKPPRGKRPPVTITISTTGVDNNGWQLEARLGAKVVVRATPLSPARAGQLVSSLDNPALSEFVADVLAEHRAQAQARADRLAQELAAVQAELAQYSAD